MDTPETDTPESSEREQMDRDIFAGLDPVIHIHSPHPPAGDAISQAIVSAQQLLRPQVISIVAPDGTQAPAYIDTRGLHFIDDEDFDQFREQPKARAGIARMLTLDSFVDHVNRFSDEDSVIFADNNRSTPTLTAMLDYHRAGALSAPRFGQHKTSFAFPLSDEWKAWTGKNKLVMKMTDFARFLEDHIIDVMPPHLAQLGDQAKLYVDSLGGTAKVADPAKLMELATGLSVYENSVVREARNLSTGEAVVEFQSEHVNAAGEKLNIPTMFIIGVPVFKGELPYTILARLRYRKDGGTIVFWFELWRTDIVFDEAFDGAVSKVRTDTARPVFIGHPEA